MTILQTQSTNDYLLLKDNETKLYYIKNVKKKKTVLIGDIEAAEDFVLYGLHELKDEIKKLKFE